MLAALARCDRRMPAGPADVALVLLPSLEVKFTDADRLG